MPLNDEQRRWFHDKYGRPTPSVEVSLDHASRGEPDKLANQLKLSEDHSVPLEAVETLEPELRRMEAMEAIKPKEIERTHPKTSKFLTNVHNATVSFDDIVNLKRHEDVLKEGRNWYDFDLSSFENFSETLGESVSQGFKGFQLAMLDMAKLPESYRKIPPEVFDKNPYDVYEEVSQQEIEKTILQIQEGEKRIQELTPKDLSILEAGVRSGVESTIRNLPGLVASLATKKPIFSLAPMTAQVGVESYGGARSKGLTPLESTAYAVEQSAIEYITEKIPADKLIDMVSAVGGKKTLKSALGFAISEIGGEQLATIGQTISDYAHGLDEQLSEAESLEEVMSIQGERQAITLFAALVGSGIQGSVVGAAKGVMAIDQAINNKTGEKIEQVFQSTQDQQILDQIIELSQSSVLQQRFSEKYKEFLTAVAADKSVYITSDALKDIPDLPKVIMDQIDGSGTDVILPMDVFVSEIASKPELMKALRPHVRLRGETLSSEELASGDSTEVKNLIAKATAAKDVKTEADRIYEDVKDQIVGTERQGDETARFSAQLIPAYISEYVARAEKKGFKISAEEAYAQMGLKVGKMEEAVKEDVELSQAPPPPATPDQNLTGFTIDEEMTVEETGENITVSQDAQVVWDDSVDRRSKLNSLLDCINGSA